MTQAVPASGSNSRFDRNVFVLLLSLYFLVLYPILRADRYYIDDLKRALVGRAGWDSNGRPLTNLLMRMLQAYDHAMVDISPLTQFGAILALAWAGVLIARHYRIGSAWMAALAAFPLGAQPFYMENLSYKFDALSMALALLLALLPVVALKHDRRGWWLGMLAIFGSLSLYQPAINVLLVFILLDVVIAQLRDMPPRELLRQSASRVLQAVVGMLAYQLLVGIHISGWVRHNARLSGPSGALAQARDNAMDFCAYIGGSFNGHWWAYFTPILVLLLLFPIVVGIGHALRNRRGQPAWVPWTLAMASLLLPLLALACIAGPMLLLAEPMIFPRVLMGVGALLSAGLVVMQAALGQWQWSGKWSLAVATMLAVGMCVFASAYGNALAAQKSYEARIAARLADDVAGLRVDHEISSYLVDGSAGLSPVTAHVAGQFPLVGRLVLPYISADDTFNTDNFLKFHLADIPDLRHEAGAEAAALASSVLARSCAVVAVATTSAYRLYLVDSTVVVAFGNTHAQRCLARGVFGQ